MKFRNLILCALFLFITETAFSQVRYGIRASAGLSNITNVHKESKSRESLQFGVNALIPITNDDLFFFEPEIHFSAQGEYYVPYRISNAKKQKVFMNYINIPLNAKMYFTDSESEFFATLGPYIGFKISDNVEKIEVPTELDDYKYKSFDFGLNAGVGFSFDREFEISLRYYYGFADQVGNDNVNKTNHTSNLNLGISYIFR